MMRIQTMTLAFILGASGSAWGQAAGQQDPSEGMSPEEFQQKVKENRAIKARFILDQRIESVIGKPKGPTRTLGGAVRVEGQLDGMVLLSRPIDRGVASTLHELGVPVLARKPTFKDPTQCIFDGRRYWRQTTRGIPDWKLRKLVGESVDLSVQRFEGEGVRIVEMEPESKGPAQRPAR